MRRKESPVLLFTFLLILSIVVYFLGKSGALNFLEKGLTPIQRSTLGVSSFLGGFGKNEEIESLKKENLLLSKQILDQLKLEEDLKALRSQFETESIRTNLLLPAEVIGIKGFIPNITPPGSFILDKGTADNLTIGSAVIFEDNFVGKIEKMSRFQSRVLLPTSSESNFAAKTQSGVSGVIKGQGNGEMVFENVLISEDLKAGDLVLTSADSDLEGGVAPNLVIGKILSVERNPSELFQKARVVPLIDYSRLTRVFILKEAR